MTIPPVPPCLLFPLLDESSSRSTSNPWPSPKFVPRRRPIVQGDTARCGNFRSQLNVNIGQDISENVQGNNLI